MLCSPRKIGFISSVRIYEWNIERIDGHVFSGHFRSTSIVTDSDNKVHICHYDGIRRELKYATNMYGNWVNYTVDITGDVGMYNSMAVDSKDRPRVSYLYFTNRVIKHATMIARGLWKLENAVLYEDNPDVSLMAIDSKDRIYICYAAGYNLEYSSATLRYAMCANGSWTYHTIVSGYVG